jgi:hypothetical protein
MLASLCCTTSHSHFDADRPENLRHTLACMAYICHVDPRSCAAVRSVPDAAGYFEPFASSSDPQISLFAFSVLLSLRPCVACFPHTCLQVLCAIQHPPSLAVLMAPTSEAFFRTIIDCAFGDFKLMADGVIIYPKSGPGLQRYLLQLLGDGCRVSNGIYWRRVSPLNRCLTFMKRMTNLREQIPTLEWANVYSLALPGCSSLPEFRCVVLRLCTQLFLYLTTVQVSVILAGCERQYRLLVEAAAKCF